MNHVIYRRQFPARREADQLRRRLMAGLDGRRANSVRSRLYFSRGGGSAERDPDLRVYGDEGRLRQGPSGNPAAVVRWSLGAREAAIPKTDSGGSAQGKPDVTGPDRPLYGTGSAGEYSPGQEFSSGPSTPTKNTPACWTSIVSPTAIDAAVRPRRDQACKKGLRSRQRDRGDRVGEAVH